MLSFKKIVAPHALPLFSVLVISGSLLIAMNFYSIKILSSTRAYVNGESHYSKAQKDASRYLITYLYTSDSYKWYLFNKELAVPKGDGKGRIELLTSGDIAKAKEGLRTGRNHEDDLDDLIWIFNNFQHISWVKKAILEWEKGDQMIVELDQMGKKIHETIENKSLTAKIRDHYLFQIGNLSDRLTINERNFSNTFGEGSRQIRDYLVLADIFFVCIIIASVSLYYRRLLHNLISVNHQIESKNKDLELVNKELDKFVYSASHDLRSPINSLQGLVQIMASEQNSEKSQYYLQLMNEVLEKQDQFIRDIVDYSRNKRQQITIETIDLKELFEETIKQHSFILHDRKIEWQLNWEIKRIESDRLRLKIIFNNLVSNAIKYCDPKKDIICIGATSKATPEGIAITIWDNGIGIASDQLPKIFEMFYVTKNNNHGTGLGLYIVCDAITLLNGRIEVTSELGKGTTFHIHLPQ
ncbi:MAG: Sensor histidine kinase RcsC [Bacteroidota bacterium]|jgi:signal transduction histidine kinase